MEVRGSSVCMARLYRLRFRFPWESARTGVDVTPDCCPEVRLYQMHITGDIAFAARQYVAASGDRSWLTSEMGGDLIYETARFWASRAVFNTTKQQYEILSRPCALVIDDAGTQEHASSCSGLTTGRRRTAVPKQLRLHQCRRFAVHRTGRLGQLHHSKASATSLARNLSKSSLSVRQRHANSPRIRRFQSEYVIRVPACLPLTPGSN